MSLAKFIRTQRQKHGWTQRELARRLDVTINSVQGWEREVSVSADHPGRPPSVPNPYQIRALSKLFATSADKLLKLLPPERLAERS
jgi:transcriptional regulator with XRE-family HTH domain